MKAQATRASREQVLEHIHRQRVLREEMIHHQEVTMGSLAITVVLLASFFAVLKFTGV